MFLSRLILNPSSRRVQKELANPYEMHRTIMSAFPAVLPVEERVLFRVDVDTRTGIPGLLVQSQDQPDWSFLAERGGRDYLLPSGDPNPAVKPFELNLHAGQVLAFKLLANPVVKKDREGKKQGRRVGLLDEKDQEAWLQRKLAEAGARVLACQVTQHDLQRSKKPVDEEGQTQTHLSVQFEGTMIVQDPLLLREAVRNGIGPAKGYGFGLLSLARQPG